MCELLSVMTPAAPVLANIAGIAGFLASTYYVLLVFIGFSVVIFFHELGHFAVAKWCDVRVERFAIGFGPELFGFSKGETRYSFNIFPLGGYVKMLGQEDFEVDASGELLQSDDPRSFVNKTVGQRMAVVSAGVFMNLVFAALLFMVVYMVGRKEVSPIVGAVIAETPAARAGLQVGDRVLAIDNSSIVNFSQIMLAVRLADPFKPLKFTIERGAETLTRYITPRESEVVNALQVGIAPMTTNTLVAVASDYYHLGESCPQPGDIIRAVNGTPVTEEVSYRDLMLQGRNQPSVVMVARADPEKPDAPPREVTFSVQKSVVLLPGGRDPRSSRDLLGLIPRVRIQNVIANSAADDAGFMENDIIVSWGAHRLPTTADIYDSILEHASRDIPVTVFRDGRLLSNPLYYRATVQRDRQGRGQPRVGFDLRAMEQDRLVVADVVVEPASAASRAGLTKGSQILAVNQTPVSRWADLVELFRVNAGSSVQVEYLPPGSKAKQTAAMDIPQSISTLLELPSFSPTYQTFNFQLDGQGEVMVKLTQEGQPILAPATRWDVIKAYLSERVGQEVEVTFQCGTDEMRTASVTVTEDMIDPWYRRVVYDIPALIADEHTYLNRQPNPLKAIWAGVRQTHYSVASAYLTLRRLIFDRTVSMENISGPVGIVHMGSKLAKYDKIAMLFFLAFLSANLAVINFLPLPIVDGGLMVFLIIEKIKGSPVSIKTQVVTQLIGIALIGTTILFVTFNDISRIFG